MIAIKLKRIGKKHQAAFRVVVMEKKSKLTGRYIEDLGWLNPHADKFDIKKERAQYWIKVGAQPTDTVYNLLIKSGVIKGAKKSLHKKTKKQGEKTETKAA